MIQRTKYQFRSEKFRSVGYVCNSVEQFVMVWRSILQCIAVCSSELQWAEVCCSVIQRVVVYDYLDHTSSLISRDYRGINQHKYHTSATQVHYKRNTRATHYNTLQHTATHCNTLQQQTATRWFHKTPRKRYPSSRHTAAHCNTLQHISAHCSTLQHTAARCSTLQHKATQCNTVQHGATHYNTLQHTATHIAPHTATHCNTHCNALQHTPKECTSFSFFILFHFSENVPIPCLTHPHTLHHPPPPLYIEKSSKKYTEALFYISLVKRKISLYIEALFVSFLLFHQKGLFSITQEASCIW